MTVLRVAHRATSGSLTLIGIMNLPPEGSESRTYGSFLSHSFAGYEVLFLHFSCLTERDELLHTQPFTVLLVNCNPGEANS